MSNLGDTAQQLRNMNKAQVNVADLFGAMIGVIADFSTIINLAGDIAKASSAAADAAASLADSANAEVLGDITAARIAADQADAATALAAAAANGADAQALQASEAAAAASAGAAASTIVGFIVIAIAVVALLAEITSSSSDPVGEALDKLHQDLLDIRNDQTAEDFLNFVGNFVKPYRNDAITNFQLLPTLLVEVPPPTDQELNCKQCPLGSLVEDLVNLGDPTAWQLPYLDMKTLFYLPAPYFPPEYTGHGPAGAPDFSAQFPVTFLPPQELGVPYTCAGLRFVWQYTPQQTLVAFNPMIILPAFLGVIGYFLNIGVTLRPTKFARTPEWANIIRDDCITPLMTYHEKILNGENNDGGIVYVAAPSAGDLVNYLQTGGIGREVPINREGSWRWDTLSGDFFYGVYDTFLSNGEFPRPYGAVDVYTGYSSIGSYPPVEGVMEMEEGEYTRFFAKYLLRCLARGKEVYRGIGLPAVWRTINKLKAMVGDPLLGPSFGDWSLKEVYNLLGQVVEGPQLIPSLSVKDLAVFLQNTTPTFSFGSGPISLRQMLEGLPPDPARL